MPRPGPRPYECVKRAWHSDRHQPMRGSIISQIFRIVTEAHSSATRKNREWQEKLPTVVIKAEEIMYSKANSEAEYLDTETLWDRLNEAIDTIIRKEETLESGEYLQPCIEAALVLGCVPVRASRSERLSNPRSYLHHTSEKPVTERQPIHHNTSIPASNLYSIARPSIAINDASKLNPNIDCSAMPSPAIEPNPSMEMCSVYPLYYGSTDYRSLSSRPNQNMSNVIFGTPVGWSSGQPAQFSSTRELFPSMVGPCGSDKPKQDNQTDTSRAPIMTDCDLSLRLGRNLDPPIVERHIQYEYEAGGSSRWASSAGELRDVSVNLGKRKLPIFVDADEGSISQQPQRRPIQFPDEIRWPVPIEKRGEKTNLSSLKR